MFCRFCGSEQRDGARFCSNCGRPLEGEPSQTRPQQASCQESVGMPRQDVRDCHLPAISGQQQAAPRQPDQQQAAPRQPDRRQTTPQQLDQQQAAPQQPDHQPVTSRPIPQKSGRGLMVATVALVVLALASIVTLAGVLTNGFGLRSPAEKAPASADGPSEPDPETDSDPETDPAPPDPTIERSEDLQGGGTSDAPLDPTGTDASTPSRGEKPKEPRGPTADELRAQLDIVEDYRAEFDHGPKGAEHQRYIVLHDTEGEGDPESVVSWWATSGNLVAAHFVVGKDGHIVQCVPLDRIAHHAGYGDTGHNEAFGIAEDGRDDMAGATPIGSSFADYGMNAWSVGIELVHVGGSGDYPPEQLEALDRLVAYIDAYYGFESEITDHKAWRSGNSDTSPEFAGYLANYQDHRTHD